MDLKKMVFIGMTVGSTVGGYVPALWGDDLFSFSSIIGGIGGGIIGIYIFYKIGVNQGYD